MLKAGRAVMRCGLAAVVAAAVGAGSMAAWAAEDGAIVRPASRKVESKNMRLVGYNDLQARSAYQPTIHKQGNRWILYVGHHGGTEDVAKPMNPMTGQAEFNGTSILDVTDPKNPKYLAHIPGEEGLGEAGGAQMVRICDGKQLPKGDKDAVYMLRVFGNQAHEMWNVTDPAKPRLITKIVENLKGTHKNFWECDTGIAYLVSGAPGWRCTSSPNPATCWRFWCCGRDVAGACTGTVASVPTSRRWRRP